MAVRAILAMFCSVGDNVSDFGRVGEAGTPKIQTETLPKNGLAGARVVIRYWSSGGYWQQFDGNAKELERAVLRSACDAISAFRPMPPRTAVSTRSEARSIRGTPLLAG
jgi:hypothetical protein